MNMHCMDMPMEAHELHDYFPHTYMIHLRVHIYLAISKELYVILGSDTREMDAQKVRILWVFCISHVSLRDVYRST